MARSDGERFTGGHPPATPHRHDLGHWPTVDRHGDTFSALDSSQHFADRVTQFPN